MDRLQDLLKGKKPAEPPEIAIIKSFVRDQFGETVEVMVRATDIVIVVSSAALANTLRLRGPDIQHACQTDKRLTFRIN